MTDKTTTTARIEGAKALIRAQFDDLWGGQNLSPKRVAEFYGPTYKGHDPILGETNGPDEVYETIRAVREAFPATTVDILDQWGTLDGAGVTVTTRYVVRSTHKGEFSGIPATDNPIELFRVNVDRVVGERIAWSWSCTDSLALYRQIGSLPTELASQMNTTS